MDKLFKEILELFNTMNPVHFNPGTFSLNSIPEVCGFNKYRYLLKDIEIYQYRDYSGCFIVPRYGYGSDGFIGISKTKENIDKIIGFLDNKLIEYNVKPKIFDGEIIKNWENTTMYPTDITNIVLVKGTLPNGKKVGRYCNIYELGMQSYPF